MLRGEYDGFGAARQLGAGAEAMQKGHGFHRAPCFAWEGFSIYTE